MRAKSTSKSPSLLLLIGFWLIPFWTCCADQVDDYVKQQMRSQHIPGISLAVIKDGKIVKAKGYGLANVERTVVANKNTVYEIASLTKQFTATAIMMLVQDHKLKLDERIADYLSGLPKEWENVTVRQLLTHTSGIKNYIDTPNYAAHKDSPITFAALVSSLANYPLEFQPGDKFEYSNTGYYLLGRILEKVSGQTYSNFLRGHILAPLGMNSTCLNDWTATNTNHASGYSWKNGSLQKADDTDVSWYFAAGGLVSTVMDLAKWDAALDTEKLLPRAALEQIWTPARLNNGTNSTYGFGWFILDNQGHRLLAHPGILPGFVSCMGRWAQDHVTVVILINNDGARAFQITRGIARCYIPGLAQP